MLRGGLEMPEVSEGEVVRYFSQISQFNFSIDHNFYPLGSCTMKYNPKLNDEMAGLPGMAEIHPHQPPATVQGALKLMYELQGLLAEITGMAGNEPHAYGGRRRRVDRHAHDQGVSPFAGGHPANRRPHSRQRPRHKPGFAAMAGYDVVTIPVGRQREHRHGCPQGRGG